MKTIFSKVKLKGRQILLLSILILFAAIAEMMLPSLLAQMINSGVTDKYKLLVVVESVRDAHCLAKQCEAVKSVNLGGSKIKEDSKQLDVAFYVTKEECTLLREMLDDSVELEIRQVPEDKKKMVTKEMLG